MVGSFSFIDGPRLEKMNKLSEEFKYMDCSESTYSGRAMCLTSYTSNVLQVTLTGLVSFMKLV